MKIAFWGIDPPRKVRLLCQENDVDLQAYTVWDIENPVVDLLIARVKNPSDLGEILKAKTDRLIVICSAEELQGKDWSKKLSSVRSLTQIWFEDIWELQMNLYLQDIVGRSPAESVYEDLRQKYEQLSQSSQSLIEQLEMNIDVVSQIQRALIPQNVPTVPGVLAHVKYIPAAGLGGDYFDLFELEEKKRLGILLADSQSHGMAASLLSILLRIRIDEVKLQFPQTRQLVDFIQTELPKLQKSDAELDLFYGVLDRSELKLHFTSAGSLLPQIWRDEAWLRYDHAKHPALGIENNTKLTETTLDLLPGDLIFLCTNGVTNLLETRSLAESERFTDWLTDRNENDKNFGRNLINEIMALWNQRKSKMTDMDDMTFIQLQIQKSILYLKKGQSAKARNA